MLLSPAVLTPLPLLKLGLSPLPILPPGSPFNSIPLRPLVSAWRGSIKDLDTPSTMKPTKTTLGLIKKLFPKPKQTTTPPSLETSKIAPECYSPPLAGSLALSMSPSFLVPLTSASSSWTSYRKKWLPFTSNSWHLPPPYHVHL